MKELQFKENEMENNHLINIAKNDTIKEKNKIKLEAEFDTKIVEINNALEKHKIELQKTKL